MGILFWIEIKIGWIYVDVLKAWLPKSHLLIVILVALHIDQYDQLVAMLMSVMLKSEKNGLRIEKKTIVHFLK